MKLTNILEEAKAEGILYHGTNHHDNPFKDSGDIFLSTSKHFASDYGDTLYVVKADLGNIFDSSNYKHIKMLYDAGFKLKDDYVTDAYDESDPIAKHYDFKNNYYPTAEDFVSTDFFPENTWEGIEHSGVLGWIFSNGFDSIKVFEDGIENYLVNTNRVLTNKRIR